MHQTQFSQKIPYGGFSQIRSHMGMSGPSLLFISYVCMYNVTLSYMISRYFLHLHLPVRSVHSWWWCHHETVILSVCHASWRLLCVKGTSIRCAFTSFVIDAIICSGVIQHNPYYCIHRYSPTRSNEISLITSKVE